MLDEHPIVRWISVASLITGVAMGAWFIIDERERSIEHGEKLAEVRHEQESIRKELAGLTLRLDRIEDNQTDRMAASDRRFEMRADEHRWLAGEINRVTGAMSTEIGRLKALTKGNTHHECRLAENR